jgi:hypothetical protein
MSVKDDITDVLNRVIGSQVQGVKLGPGVVGRNSSIAYALEFVMLAGVIAGIFLHSVWLVGISLCGAIVSGLWIARMNVTFGRENPAAAILEGAEFLQFHQLQAMAIKGDPHVIELPLSSPAPPEQLIGADPKNQLSNGTESKP